MHAIYQAVDIIKRRAEFKAIDDQSLRHKNLGLERPRRER